MDAEQKMKQLLNSSVALVVMTSLPIWLSAADVPDTPRIDSVVMAEQQPHESDAALIWYDNFDNPQQQKRYAEDAGDLSDEVRFGHTGRSLLMRYPTGSRGIGGRKVFFGDSPTNRRQTVRGEESFTDVYWRIYVKHQSGWTGGGPDKLSRATSLVAPDWRQSMIAHVWSSGEALTLDPASGVRGDRVQTTKYNDFGNLRWLGNKPASQFKLHSREESGRWVCVESRAKLNTPGERDGLNQLWIDGRLEAERRNLDWRGSYVEHGINAVFLEAYWNQGSPVDQSRWIDNFVISTEPIGPVSCPRNPVLIKTPYRGPGRQQAWEVEVSCDDSSQAVVWKSKPIHGTIEVSVGTDTGSFVGLANTQQLTPASLYFVRVRQQNDAGQWSDWSPWHHPFRSIE
jgi:hypothetical protein